MTTGGVKLSLSAASMAVALLFAHSVEAQTSASDFTTGYRWDALGRKTGEIAPDPGSTGPHTFLATRYTYDQYGQIIRTEVGYLSSWQSDSIDPNAWSGFSVSTVTDVTYDQNERKIQESVSSNSVIQSLIQYSYDSVGRLLCTAVRMDPAQWASQTDACVPQTSSANGPDRITKNVYDAAGQLVQVRKGVGTSLEQAYATYAYSANGKQTDVIDANGNRATYTYDGFDRLVQWTFPSTSAPASFNGATQATALSSAGSANSGDYEAYAYDANSNRTSFRKRDGSVLGYTYDALNRVTVKAVPSRSGLGSTHTRSVYYSYDLQGHQLAAQFDGIGGEGVTSTFDGFGRQLTSSITMDGATRTVSYQYDANGNRTRVTHPDGVYVQYGYDGLDRMANGSWWAPASGTVPFLSISYDSAGRRSSINRASSYTNYGYDGISRLNTLAQQFANGDGNESESFSYNPASQITSFSKSNNSYIFNGLYNVNRGYTTNGLNQYTAAGAASFAYDANGNLTSDGTTTFLYDIENRLVNAGGAKNAQLRYDPLGRLYEISGPTGTTRFAYDGDALIGEFDASGNLLRRYMWGSNPDEPILWDEGSAMNCSGTKVLHHDHQGSIIATADCWGGLSTINTYDEYGIPGSNNTGRFQYTGQAWTSELGMYYYKARFYSPTLGRFLQTDPIGYKDQINLYAYVGNDPMNGTDPTGLMEEGAFSDRWSQVTSAYRGTGRLLCDGDCGGNSGYGKVAKVAGAVVTGLGFTATGVAEVASDGIDTPLVPAELEASVAAGEATSVAVDATLTVAAKYGVQSYSALTKLLKGTGLEAHHLFEKRFANLLGQKVSKMSSIALTKAEHQAFTNAWRQAIPYGRGTITATSEQVMATANKIYSQLPEVVGWLGK